MSEKPPMYGSDPDHTLRETLAAMHPKEPFRLAVFGSGKSFARLCEEMPCSESWLRRVLEDEKFYPSYPRLPRFCEVTGSPLPRLWLSAQAGEEAKLGTLEAAELLASMVAMQARLGEAGLCALEITEDTRLNSQELKRQIGALTPLIHMALHLVYKLRTTLTRQTRSVRTKGL